MLRRRRGERREPVSVSIVEDDPDLARLLELQVLSLGHRVVEVRQDEFEKLVAEGFDECAEVVLVDLLLGARVDGIDVARAICVRCPGTGVVICSAVPVVFRRELDRLVEEGIVDEVTTKPVSMKELDAAIRAARKES